MCNESAIKILHTFVLILGKFSPAAKKAGGIAIILSSTQHTTQHHLQEAKLVTIIHTICAAIYTQAFCL